MERLLHSRDLSAKKLCNKRRQHDSLNLWDAGNPTAARAMALRTAIKDFVLASDDSWVKECIFNKLNESLEAVNYPNNIQKNRIMDEAMSMVQWYIDIEKEASDQDKSREHFVPKTKIISIFGTDVIVQPDMVIKSNGHVEALKLDFKTSKLQISGKTVDCIQNNLEAYALWRYAVEEADNPTDICSGGFVYPFVGKAKDSERKAAEENWTKLAEEARVKGEKIPRKLPKTKPLLSTDGPMISALTLPASAQNIASAIYAQPWMEFQTGKNCDEADCMYCQFRTACEYQPVTTAKKRTAPKKKKLLLTPSTEQENAIMFENGIARIKAGAGAGKTFVIAMRVMNLILSGYDPEKILLTTFTNGGVQEMMARVAGLCEDYGISSNVADKVKICTFNSFENEIVMKEYAACGFSEPPTLADTITKKMMILRSVDNTELHGVNYDCFEGTPMNKNIGGFSTILKMYDYLKVHHVSRYNWTSETDDMEKIRDNAPVRLSITDEQSQRWIDAYEDYCNLMKESNLMEYSDQELFLSRIINADPYYLENNVPLEHIIVDEFQDSDANQMALLKKMIDSRHFKSLLVVGDDAQNIFESFRGTKVENIIRFEEIIGKEITDFTLMDNYRSTPEIIALANSINAKRNIRIDGQLNAKKHSAGKMITPAAFGSESAEYEWIADKIHEDISNGIAAENICVIAGTSKELNEVGKELAKRNIPWWMLVAEKVLQNSRVRASIDLAEFIEDTSSTNCIFNYLNVINDGKLLDIFSDEEIAAKIEECAAYVNSALADGTDRYAVYKELEKNIDSSDEVYASFREKTDKRRAFRDILAYSRTMRRFGHDETYKRKALAGTGVVLATIHSSKGLEWEKVYLVCDKIHKKECLAEESRRKLFTGITRAKDELVCTGVLKKESTFISEIYTETRGIPFTEIPVIEDERKKEEEKRRSARSEIIKKMIAESVNGVDESCLEVYLAELEQK